jgi:hypothetical protein
MFSRHKPPQNKQIKLGLDSDISINLIDVAHLDLHPSFVRPEGPFFIQAIGEIKREGGEDVRNTFNVYAKNNEINYLIEIESIEDRIERVVLYQNVSTLTPKEPNEWQEVLDAISLKELEMDGVTYSRILGGDADKADLCRFNELVRAKNDEFDCNLQVMQFERKINPGEFTEKLTAIVEMIESRQQAMVSFYIGFNVHPSMVTILGN